MVILWISHFYHCEPLSYFQGTVLARVHLSPLARAIIYDCSVKLTFILKKPVSQQALCSSRCSFLIH
jgi:hypothetical protein